MLARLAAASVFALAATFASAQVKIGLMVSSTGPTTAIGIPQKNTGDLLPRKIGDATVEYFQLDDGGDTTRAVQNIKKLIQENNIDAMIGPSTTPNAFAILDIVAEAKALLVDGVKELNLISQDSTYYGLDLRENHSRAISSPEKFSAAAKALPANSTTICTLLRELNALKGDFWIRLLYTHPAHWTDELIQTIAECKKVARYVDIPLQHIHENMLERMRRETSKQYIVDLLKHIRAGVPGIALRTTFIVGFPGETDASFKDLLEFIEETKFERLGVFAYSKEDGTRAGAMAGQLSDKIKQRRRELAMAAQHQIAKGVAESFVGRTLKVLIEGKASAKQLAAANVSSWEHGLMREADTSGAKLPSGEFLVARGEADAPDIDGRVYIRGKLPIGEFAQVKVIGHTDYDLIAKPV